MTDEWPIGYNTFHSKQIDNPDFITILCATRGRPDILKLAITSFDQTTFNKDLVDIWLLVDDDDSPTLEFLESGWPESVGLSMNWIVGERPRTLSAGLNALWRAASNAGVYLATADDHIMLTPGWDAHLRKIFNDGPDDRHLVAQITEVTRESDDLILWANSAEWSNTVGRLIPPYFPFWFWDMWIDQVSIMAGRKVQANVDMRPHSDEIAATGNMGNLKFWWDYFNLLFFERAKEAELLLAAIHGAGTDAYREALRATDHSRRFYEAEAANRPDENSVARIQALFSDKTKRRSKRLLLAEVDARLHLNMVKPEIHQSKMNRLLKYKQEALEDSWRGRTGDE